MHVPHVKDPPNADVINTVSVDNLSGVDAELLGSSCLFHPNRGS